MKCHATDKQRSEFQKMLARLSKLRDTQEGDSRGYSDLVKRKSGLQEREVTLAKADPGDRAARAALVDTRTELGMVEQQLAAETARLGTLSYSRVIGAETAQALKDADHLITTFAGPLMESRLAELKKVVRSICVNEEEARSLAFQSSAYKSFCAVWFRGFGGLGRTHVGVLDEAIALIEQILAGEVVYTFDSKE